MTPQRLRAGAEDYYLGPVAAGVEVPGRWMGRGAAALGLSGDVGAAELARVMRGEHPVSAERLPSRPTSVAAHDLVLAAPKSLSVLWALGDEDLRAAVNEALGHALEATVDYLDCHAGRGRGGFGGGLVGAAFDHRVSRSADPHLHTHLVVANLARDGGGRWSALDSRHLYAEADTARFLYHGELRRCLTLSAGLRWGTVHAGVAQIAGLEPDLVRLFSIGRQRVRSGMAAHGGRSARSAAVAALDGRPERHDGLNADVLFPRWRARALDAGFDLSQVASDSRGPMLADPGRSATDVEARVLAGLSGRSSFGRRDVIEAVCSAHPAGLSASTAEALTERVLGSEQVRTVTTDLPPRTRDVMRVGRRLVPLASDQRRWCTADRQAAEEAVIEAIDAQPRRVRIADLAPGQSRSVTLDRHRRRWSGLGLEVRAVAPDARAGREFEASTGIETAVERAWYASTEADAGAGRRSASSGVLVVVGAEVVDPFTLGAALASGRGPDIVLVGDSRPLQRDDRGGVWRALRNRPELELEPVPTPAPALATAPGRATAVSRSSERDGPAVVTVGRLNLAADTEAARAALVAEFRALRARGEQAVMVAVRRSDIEDLNRRAGLSAEDGARTPYRARACAVDRLLVLGDPMAVDGTPLGGARMSFYAVAGPARAVELRPDLGRLDRLVTDSVGDVQHSAHSPLSVIGERIGELRRSLGAPPPDPSPTLDRLDEERAACQSALQRLGERAPESAMWSARLERVAQSIQGLEPDARARAAWVADHCDELATLAGLVSAAGERSALLGKAAELDPPRYLLERLGPPPEDAYGRRLWRSAAGRAEAFRERWGLPPVQLSPKMRAELGPDQVLESREVESELRSTGVLLGHRGLQRSRVRSAEPEGRSRLEVAL